MADVKLSQLAAVSPASQAAGATLWTLPGHIDGLRMVRTAANALRVDPGSAWIQSLGFPVQLAAAITKTGLTLTAATWYHVYLFMNGASLDIEISTVAPAAVYFGTARSKTGAPTHRYLGSIRTLGANVILPFYHSPANNVVKYMQNINDAPLPVLSGGVATSNTNVNCANAVPSTSRLMYSFAENRAADVAALAYISNSEAGAASGTMILEFLRVGGLLYGDILLDASQQFNYVRQTASDQGLSVWCVGYVYER